MADPRQPYKGLSEERLVDMANSDNGTNWKLGEDLEFSSLKVRVSPGGRNTAIEVLPLKPTHKQQTLTYTRLPLDVMYSLTRDQLRPVKLESVPFSIHEKLDEINDALGLTLTPEEVVDTTYTEVKGIYELQIAHNTASVAWLQSKYQFVADFGLEDQRYDTYGWPRIDTYGNLRRDQSLQTDTGGGGDGEEGELVATITFVADPESFPFEDSGVRYYIYEADSSPLGLTGKIQFQTTQNYNPTTGLKLTAYTVAHVDGSSLDYQIEVDNGVEANPNDSVPTTISVGVITDQFISPEPTQRIVKFFKRTPKASTDRVEVKMADVTELWIETNDNVEIQAVKAFSPDGLTSGLYSNSLQRMDALFSTSTTLTNFSLRGFTIKKSIVNGKEGISIVGMVSAATGSSVERQINIGGRVITFIHGAYPFFEETIFKETNPAAYDEYDAILNMSTVTITEQL